MLSQSFRMSFLKDLDLLICQGSQYPGQLTEDINITVPARPWGSLWKCLQTVACRVESRWVGTSGKVALVTLKKQGGTRTLFCVNKWETAQNSTIKLFHNAGEILKRGKVSNRSDCEQQEEPLVKKCFHHFIYPQRGEGSGLLGRLKRLEK